MNMNHNGAYTLAWTAGYIAGPALAGFALAANHGYALFIVLIALLAVAELGAWRLERWLPTTINRIGADSTPRSSAAPADDLEGPSRRPWRDDRSPGK